MAMPRPMRGGKPGRRRATLIVQLRAKPGDRERVVREVARALQGLADDGVLAPDWEYDLLVRPEEG